MSPHANNQEQTWYLRIQHRFGTRWPEWFGAMQMTLLGIVLVTNPVGFESSQAFGIISQWTDEGTLGTILFWVGIVRFAGLAINGAIKEVTPWIRAVSAFVCFWVLLTVVYGFFLTGIVFTWLPMWGVPMIAELVNIYRALHDARQSRNG